MKRPALAIGVISDPRAGLIREAARASWFRDPAVLTGQTWVRFVLGDVPCAKDAASDEAREFGDISFVDAQDCKKWHSAGKVHAWYKHALEKTAAPWLAKMEDDGMLRVSALLHDLGRLRHAEYYGVLRWGSSCIRRADGDECPPSCFAGDFEGRQRSACRVPRFKAARWSGCRWSAWEPRTKCCDDACAAPDRMVSAPFACGPLDVRSRVLARRLAGCAAADRLFRAAATESERGAAMCISTDGAQGAALTLCHARHELRLADATDARFEMGHCHDCGRCGRGSVLLHHPLKEPGLRRHESKAQRRERVLDSWATRWRAITRHQYTPPPLPEYSLNLTRRRETERAPQISQPVLTALHPGLTTASAAAWRNLSVERQSAATPTGRDELVAVHAPADEHPNLAEGNGFWHEYAPALGLRCAAASGARAGGGGRALAESGSGGPLQPAARWPPDEVDGPSLHGRRLLVVSPNCTDWLMHPPSSESSPR